MKKHFKARQARLAKDAAVPLTRAQGTTVWCRHGEIWITQDGDLRDIVLGPGERFRLDARSALVSALTDAEIVLQPAAGTNPVRARVQWLRGCVRGFVAHLSHAGRSVGAPAGLPGRGGSGAA